MKRRCRFAAILHEQNTKRDGTIGEKSQSIGTDERLGQVADLLPGRLKNSEPRIQKARIGGAPENSLGWARPKIRVPHLRRSQVWSRVIPALRPGLHTAASLRLARISPQTICSKRVGEETRREAPGVRSHARERVVIEANRTEARRAGTPESYDRSKQSKRVHGISITERCASRCTGEGCAGHI